MEMDFTPNGRYRFKDLSETILTPVINHLFGSVKYNGQYTWFGEWQNGKRPVIETFYLKGDSSILKWGWNYDFLPEESSGKLRYFRTDKNAKAQLYDFPLPFINSVDFSLKTDWRPYLIPMHANSQDKLIAKIEDIWKLTLLEIQSWFSQDRSFNQDIVEVDRQLSYGAYYKLLCPERTYMKAFFLAKIERKDEAELLIRKSRTWQNANKTIRETMFAKLKSI